MEKDWEELPKFFTPALRKRVVKDWHYFFPSMGCRGMGFDYLLGPLKVGFGFRTGSDRENYSPEFSVHNLLQDLDFLTATLNTSLKNARGNPNTLTLRWHDKNYRDAAHHMQEQALIPLDRPSSLEFVIDTYKHFIESRCEWELDSQLEDPVLLASWGGKLELAQECLNWSYDIMLNLWKRGPEKSDAWRNLMEEKISDPDKLRQIAREQIVFHKLSKVPSCCFTDTPYQECLTKVPFPKT